MANVSKYKVLSGFISPVGHVDEGDTIQLRDDLAVEYVQQGRIVLVVPNPEPPAPAAVGTASARTPQTQDPKITAR